MLMCIGRDTIDNDDKLTSYPELCHGERICRVEEFSLFCRSDRRQKRERIRFIPTGRKRFPLAGSRVPFFVHFHAETFRPNGRRTGTDERACKPTSKNMNG